jgi:hypothetical protein
MAEHRFLLSGMPQIDPGVLVQNGGSPLAVEYAYGFTAPCVADWDGDGKKDLLIGQFYQGKISFFRNQGTDAAPVFNQTGFNFLQAAGSTIQTTYG